LQNASRCAGSLSLNSCRRINTYGWNFISFLTMRWNVLRLNPRPFLLVERRPFSSRDCRTKPYASVCHRTWQCLKRIQPVPNVPLAYASVYRRMSDIFHTLAYASTIRNSVTGPLGILLMVQISLKKIARF
jgi:hypothetical protein